MKKTGSKADQRNRSRNRDLLYFALIVAAAVVVRLAYLAEMAGGPFFRYPIIDAAEYYGWGSVMAAGEWLWSRVHIHGPLYPAAIGALLKLGSGFRGLYLLNHLLGVGTLILLFLAGRRLGGRIVGFVAASAALLYARFLYFEGLLLATTLVTFLDMAMLWAALELEHRRRSPAWWAPVGLLLGLSAIARPTALILLPALLYWVARRRPSDRARAGRRRALAVAAGVIVIVAPVTLRNVAIGDPVLVQANGGMNFYIANRSGADGLASVRPGTEWKAIERLANEAGAVREADRDRFYYGLGLREIFSDPVAAAGRIGCRLYLFWSGREVDTSHDFSWFREHSTVLRLLALPAGLILPFALAGLIAALRRRGCASLPALLVLSYILVILAFPYSSRYRMPVFPYLILLAAASAAALIALAQKGEPAAVARRVIPVVAGLIALNVLPLGMGKEGLVRTPLYLGKRLFDQGGYRGAITEYDRALAVWEDDADVWNNRGLAFEGLGDGAEARRCYERAITAAPAHAKARANLAGIFYRQGKADSARMELERAIAAEPGNADFYNNLGALIMQGGDPGRAAEVFEAGLRLAPAHRDILYNLGRAYEKTGRRDDAERTYRRLVEAHDVKQARYRLGIIEESRGDASRALVEYERALELDPDYPEVLRSLGILRLRIGNHLGGRALLQRYLAIHPEDRQVAEMLAGKR